MSSQLENKKSFPVTLCELLNYHIQHYDHSNALNFKSGGAWKNIPSKDFFSMVQHTSLGLHSLGVKRGDRIALLSENSPYWVISDYSVTSLGAALVPIYVTQMKEQVEFIIKNAGVKVFLISSKPLFDRVKETFSNLDLDHIIIFDSFASGEKIKTLAEIQALGKALLEKNPALFDDLRKDISVDTAASVIYTSGTTGDPKGVVLTHGNLAYNAVSSSAVIEWFPGDDVALSFLPLSHIFERTMINIYLYTGLPIYFAESIEALAQNLLEVRPTIMSTVPRMLEKVYDRIQQKGSELTGLKRKLFNWSIRLADQYKHENGNSLWYKIQRAIASAIVFSKWRAGVGGRIRFIISGGAPLPVHLAKVYLAAGIPVVQGYGLTETSPVIAVNTLKRNRLGSVGPLIPNVEVKFADDNEILTRGPHVMKGFYNDPEGTKKVFTDDWFHTGDIGYMDPDGFLFITDRKKDLMKKSSGKFIAPGPIETKLSGSRYIEFAVVIAEGRKFAIALIFPSYMNLKEWAKKQGVEVKSNDELLKLSIVEQLYQQEIDKVNADLNPWERIIKSILIEPELTIDKGDLTPTLKVRRRIIEQKFKDRIDKLYEEYKLTD